jgi:hypothetical protein
MNAFAIIYLLMGIIVPTGEDEGEELYVLNLQNKTYEYVTEQELSIWINTGVIRDTPTVYVSETLRQ